MSAAEPRVWAVTFETSRQRVTCKGTGPELGQAVTIAFRQAMREAMTAGGCRSFSVGVHPDGAECDHEVG